MWVPLLLACVNTNETPVTPPAPAIEAPPAPSPAPPPPPRPVVLGFVGDVIPHASVRDSAAAQETGWDALFADLAPRIRALDWAVANLETPVTSPSTYPTGAKVFDAPRALPEAMVRAGFDAVTLANNHTWDAGVDGLVTTLDTLDAAGLAHAGAGRTCTEAWTPRIIEVQGVKIGWIAATRILNFWRNRGEDDPCVAHWDEATVYAAAAAARAAGAELVVASVHWGVEYQHSPRSWDREMARRMVAAGVDIVAGHHPHFLQPVERVEAGGRVGWVAYSLGNFLAGQGWNAAGTRFGSLETRDSLLLEVEVQPDPVRVTAVRAVPLWIEHGTDACRRTPGARSRIRPVELGTLLRGLDPKDTCGAGWRASRARIAAMAGDFLVEG